MFILSYFLFSGLHHSSVKCVNVCYVRVCAWMSVSPRVLWTSGNGGGHHLKPADHSLVYPASRAWLTEVAPSLCSPEQEGLGQCLERFWEWPLALDSGKFTIVDLGNKKALMLPALSMCFCKYCQHRCREYGWNLLACVGVMNGTHCFRNTASSSSCSVAILFVCKSVKCNKGQ